MSQTETHIGKLRKVSLENFSNIEEWSKQKCFELNLNELESYYRGWFEKLSSETEYRNYFKVDDEIWESIEHTEIDEGDNIDYMVKNDDGTVSYVTQFYNGGTYLGECIEDGLRRLK